MNYKLFLFCFLKLLAPFFINFSIYEMFIKLKLLIWKLWALIPFMLITVYFSRFSLYFWLNSVVGQNFDIYARLMKETESFLRQPELGPQKFRSVTLPLAGWSYYKMSLSLLNSYYLQLIGKNAE